MGAADLTIGIFTLLLTKLYYESSYLKIQILLSDDNMILYVKNPHWYENENYT